MRNLLLVLLLISSGQLQAQPWHWINPSNGHHHLNDISFITPGNGIAVADNGVILHYNDQVWTKAESPISENLNAIYYLSPTLAWAVGDNGTILKFNGSDWEQQESFTTGPIMDVCFVDETHGWAVGNAILFYDGSSWQVQQEASNLTTVSFATSVEGWAAGLYNTLYHYNGGNWDEDYSFTGGNYLMFKSIEMTGPSNVWLNGYNVDGNGLLYQNAGPGWQVQNADGINSGISFTDNQHGFGIQNFIAFNTDIYPSVYKYTSSNWSKEFSIKQGRQLTSVEAISENEAYISDTTGFVFHGLDGNWGVSNGFTADSILDIDFTRANNGYFACGTDGIWHYDAGNWINELRVPGFRFNEVRFPYENYGWASAYRKTGNIPPYAEEVKFYNCIDGIWNEETIPVFEGLWEPATSLDFSFWGTTGITSYNILYTKTEGIWDTTFLAMSDSITELRFMDPFPINKSVKDALPAVEEAWMSIKRLEGEIKGAVYFNDFTNDTWNISYETTSGAFNDLCVADYMNIFAVGDNGLIAHFNGQTWSEFEPVTSEDLLSVFINDENEGWASGRNGILLSYDGITWSVRQSNTWNDLNKVSFYQNFGLIGGENGTLFCTQPELPVGNTYSFVGSVKEMLTISPNPAKNNVLVQFKATGNSPAELQITDITGRLVFEQSVPTAGSDWQTVSIDLQLMKNGVYLVKVNTGRKILTGKILIQK